MEEIAVLTTLTIQMCVLSVVSYSLKCPSQANWKLRAQGKCNSTFKYFCLYDRVTGEYIEGCNGPDWDRKGSKRIYAGDFSRGYCVMQRYQPFEFWTNGSVSDCIYSKSICSDEGNVVYTDILTTDDRTCRCDHTKGYSFNKTPKNLCFCVPSEEDCSCHIKLCQANLTLSADYSCTIKGFTDTLQCTDTAQHDETFNHKQTVIGQPTYIMYTYMFRYKVAVTMVTYFIIFFTLIHLIVAGGFLFFQSSFKKRIHEKYIERYTKFKKIDVEGGSQDQR